MRSNIKSFQADDEFAQDVSEFDTLDEYKADLKSKMEKEAQETADRNYENEIIQKRLKMLRLKSPM